MWAQNCRPRRNNPKKPPNITTQPSKIKVDPYNNKVTMKPFKVVSATSWLEYGGYAAQKMLLPSSHVLQVIELAGDKKEIKVQM